MLQNIKEENNQFPRSNKTQMKRLNNQEKDLDKRKRKYKSKNNKKLNHKNQLQNKRKVNLALVKIIKLKNK